MYVVETEENDLQSRDLELSLDSRNPTRRRGRELGPGNLYHGDDFAGDRRAKWERKRERERSVPNGIQIKGFIGDGSGGRQYICPDIRKPRSRFFQLVCPHSNLHAESGWPSVV